MIREEILKLEAGPELDRLVAERVMGWKEGKNFGVGESGIVRYIREGQKYFERTRIEAWSPSTDIAAAWEVVSSLSDKFDVLINGVGFVKETSGEKGVSWWVEFIGDKRSFKAEALSLPVAICRAALLARREDS